MSIAGSVWPACGAPPGGARATRGRGGGGRPPIDEGRVVEDDGERGDGDGDAAELHRTAAHVSAPEGRISRGGTITRAGRIAGRSVLGRGHPAVDLTVVRQ